MTIRGSEQTGNPLSLSIATLVTRILLQKV